VGVDEEPRALSLITPVIAAVPCTPGSKRDHAAQVAQLLVEAADHAGDQRIGLAALDHQRGDQRRPRAHQVLGRIGVTPRRSVSAW
jgi:hypothetical protein